MACLWALGLRPPGLAAERRRPAVVSLVEAAVIFGPLANGCVLGNEKTSAGWPRFGGGGRCAWRPYLACLAASVRVHRPRSTLTNRDSAPFFLASMSIAAYRVAWGVLPPGLDQ